jgi:hypothetical protein
MQHLEVEVKMALSYLPLARSRAKYERRDFLVTATCRKLMRHAPANGRSRRSIDPRSLLCLTRVLKEPAAWPCSREVENRLEFAKLQQTRGVKSVVDRVEIFIQSTGSKHDRKPTCEVIYKADCVC